MPFILISFILYFNPVGLFYRYESPLKMKRLIS